MRQRDVSERQVRIPVRYRDGTVTFFYKGPMPEIEEDAFCELVVPAYALKNAAEAGVLTAVNVVPLLGEGISVFAEVFPSGAPLPETLVEGLIETRSGGHDRNHVRIKLLASLGLELRGTAKATLLPVPCEIPALGAKADSINHAYRLISEAYEPHRRSHSANVFRAIYLQDGENWTPLDVLRQAKEAEWEQSLIERLAQVAAKEAPLGKVGGPLE
jgi:hypothetical protein